VTGGLAAVTGASGFVGSHLVEALVAAGLPTRAITRETSDRSWLPPEAERATAALDDDAALERAIRGASIVFHLAAVTSSARDVDYTRSNVDGTRRVLEAVRRCAADARVVICSSLAAVGPARDEHLLTEDDAPHPVSVYGRSKLAAERVAESVAAEQGLDIVVVRPGAVYGPRDRDILAAFKLADRGFALRVSSERQRLAMIHVRDLTAALLLAGERGRAASGNARRYHVSDGIAHRWTAVNQAIGQAVGRRVRVIAVPRPAAAAVAVGQSFLARVRRSKPLLTRDRIAELSAPNWSCDISRARRELGFEPRVSLAEGMRETARWYREQGWL
jgi:nucleoside-diphosphate-sugar epimerase